MIKAVVFDMDGTLVDTEPLLERIGQKIKEEITKGVAVETPRKGTGLRDYYAQVAKACGTTCDSHALTLRHFQTAMKAMELEGVSPTNGAVALVEYLAAMGVKMGVASSSDRNYVEYVLQKIGFAPYVQAITCGDEAALKPSPALYLETLKKLGVCAEESIAVEDSYTGFQAALNAKLRCVQYRDDTLVNVPQYEGSLACVSDLRDIIALIEKGEIK